MARYQLKKRCLFVDAIKHKKPEDEDYDIDKREPQEIPYAHVMHVKDDSGSETSATYLPLNNMAGFITRFIVQGVDTDDLLPKIIQSEYGISQDQATKDVTAIEKMLKGGGFIIERKHKRNREDPLQHPGTGGNHPGKYSLDFKVNFFGAGFLKGPL